jgi:hypothetical protein
MFIEQDTGRIAEEKGVYLEGPMGLTLPTP